jgi:hypothetical protein
MLFAQLPSELSSPLVSWLLGGSAALFLLNQALTFWKDHMREQPAARDTYATKEDHEALIAEVDARFEKLNEDRRRNVTELHGKIDDMRREVKSDVHGVHDRITALLASFSEVKGAVTNHLKNSIPPFGK